MIEHGKVAAAIYARISKDDADRRLGVERQRKDGHGEASARGWSVADVYEDNDVSAYSGRQRPSWNRLLADVRAGRVNAIVASEATRLTRGDLRDCEDFLDLARDRGLRVVTIAEGEYDLARAAGRKRFRDDAVKARSESETMSERIKRQRDQAAEEGRPHGMIAFGYRRERTFDEYGRLISTRDVIDPGQAAVIREAATRLLEGESLRSVVRELNARGLVSPKGAPWSSTTLRQVMLRDRNAGLRRHRGHVIGDAAWEPIYDEGRHNRVKALLKDPSRTVGRSDKGATRKHLLSGIAKCGRCGGVMRATPGTTYRAKTISPKYQCKECLKVGRKKELVDQIVIAVAIERLRQPDAIRALATGRPERAEELQQLIAEADARLNLAADGFADGIVTGDQFRRIGARLVPEIEGWRVELAACAPHDGLLDLAGPDAAERWHGVSLDRQRAALDVLMSVTVLPTGPGIRFDPDNVRTEEGGRVIVFSDSIKIEWKVASE